MAAPRRRNPWTSVGEILTWLLFVALLFPAGFAGWAIGHYTSLGKSSGTRTVTVTQTTPATAATSPAATTSAAPTTPATTAATTTAASAAGNATAGKTVFASAACGSCHTFKPAGATGTVGPDLDSRPQQDAQKANMPLAAFLRQSIVDPNAFVASGYPKGIMPTTFGQQLSKTQLDDLVAFLSSGS